MSSSRSCICQTSTAATRTSLKKSTSRIIIPDWVVPTICEHVIAYKSLAGAYIAIRVKESADLGVVVAGPEVVEPGFVVVVVGAVAEGVQVLDDLTVKGGAAVGIDDIAPGIVAVAGCQSGLSVTVFVDIEDVALQILDEVIIRPGTIAGAPQGNADHTAALIVVVAHVQHHSARGGIVDLAQVPSVSDMVQDIATVGIGLLDPQAVAVIFVGGSSGGTIIGRMVGSAFQPSALSPGEGIVETVVIGQGIAQVIMGKGLIVHTSHQVCPVGFVVIAIATGGLWRVFRGCILPLRYPYLKRMRGRGPPPLGQLFGFGEWSFLKTENRPLSFF